MALVARRISRQEFQSRRRDRRMIAVDVAALIVGSLLLVTSVGALVAVKPVVTPAEWTVSFAEEESIYKVCAMINTNNPPCADRPIGASPQLEGDANRIETTIQVHPDRREADKKATGIGAENATGILIELTWVDPIIKTEKRDPEADPDQPESWDEFELEVIPPPDSGLERLNATGISDGPNKDGMSGAIRLSYNLSETPQAFNVTAMSHGEAASKAGLAPTAAGVGTWTVRVTLKNAGDIQGNTGPAPVPNDACPDEVPDDVAVPKNPADVGCKTKPQQTTLEELGLASTGEYKRGYEDEKNEWILDFVVVHWSARIT